MKEARKINDLVNGLLFMDLSLCQLSRSEKLLQHGGTARVWELIIQVGPDEIEKGLEIGVTGVLGKLLAGFVQAG